MDFQNCFHCGDVIDVPVVHQNKSFCCSGCKNVYQIIHEAGLEGFYDGIKEPVGVKVKPGFLDSLKVEEVANELLDYKGDDYALVSFVLPTIHCASCVWLLERLPKLNTNIIDSKVDFFNKRVSIRFNNETSLYELAKLLQKIGYPPQLYKSKKQVKNHDLIIKIGVAGFAFGNIMLLSFPEYVSEFTDSNLKSFFAYLSIALSIPVLIYSANVFYKNVWLAAKAKKISIDIPIVLGILSLFIRSLYDIFYLNEQGYLDSLSGLIFFLLLGKWFQSKVFSELSFERNANEYLPLAVLKKEKEEFNIVAIDKVKQGDVIKIRQGEIIPFDGILLSDEALIDQSFINGEELPELLLNNNKMFCGGKVTGNDILIEVTSIHRNDLFRLWSSGEQTKEISDRLITVFTYVVLFLGGFSFLYHYLSSGAHAAFIATTSVLIVACPCALALVVPSISGITIRKLAKRGYFLKSTKVVDQLQHIQNIVFDKTGTLTGKEHHIIWKSFENIENESKFFSQINAIAKLSTHPLSSLLEGKLKAFSNHDVLLQKVQDVNGEGVIAFVEGKEVKLGKASFINFKDNETSKGVIKVFVKIDEKVMGYFGIKLSERADLSKLFNALKSYELFLLSGDPNLDESKYNLWFKDKNIYKNQSPQDKLTTVERVNYQGSTLMIGDGINDTLALNQADVGLAVIEQNGAFFPKCDGILIGDQLHLLSKIINTLKRNSIVKNVCYVFSFIYNSIGFYLAFSLKLTPLAASILMPISTVTVVLLVALLLNNNWKKIPVN